MKAFTRELEFTKESWGGIKWTFYNLKKYDINIKNSLNESEITLHTAEVTISKLEDRLIENLLSEVRETKWKIQKVIRTCETQ